MASRRDVNQPVQPEQVERMEREPRWIPESELQFAFPTEQRMRQRARQEALTLEIVEKYKPKTIPKNIEFGNDD
eukprot:12885232-Prorocentrum_lima.AAC.1